MDSTSILLGLIPVAVPPRCFQNNLRCGAFVESVAMAYVDVVVDRATLEYNELAGVFKRTVPPLVNIIA